MTSAVSSTFNITTNARPLNKATGRHSTDGVCVHGEGVRVCSLLTAVCVHLSKMQSINSWYGATCHAGFTSQSINSMLKHQYKGAREEIQIQRTRFYNTIK